MSMDFLPVYHWIKPGELCGPRVAKSPSLMSLFDASPAPESNAALELRRDWLRKRKQ